MRKISFCLALFAVLLPLKISFADDRSDDRDLLTSDINETWSGARNTSLTWTRNKWTISLAGGLSYVNDVNSSMHTEPANLTFTFRERNWLLIFPASDYSVTGLGHGHAAELAVSRELQSWLSLGLQGGLSFEHKQDVASGPIRFTVFDSGGQITSSTIETYTVQYKVAMYHVVPTLTLGPWIRTGKYGVRPYATGGVGYYQVQESVDMSLVGVDFPLGWRSTDYVGTLVAGGLDFRISDSGAIGAKYEYHHVSSNGQKWSWSVPALHFSYLF